jgi:DNA-directed RNA polymerase subunit RPC12/RpoP
VLVAYFDEAGSFDRTDEARGETPVFAPWGQRFGALVSKAKDEAVPLQAADILAYETYKHILDLNTGEQRGQRKTLIHLVQPLYPGAPPRVNMKWSGRQNFEEVVGRSRRELQRAAQSSRVYMAVCLDCHKFFAHYAPFPKEYVRCSVCGGRIERYDISKEEAAEFLSRFNQSQIRDDDEPPAT